MKSNPLKIYLDVIEFLITYEKNGRKLYIEDKKQIHFKPSVFRNYLKQSTGENKYKEYLRLFRLLDLIVVSDQNVFTNIKRIKGKLTRVITIDKLKLSELKKFENM